MSSLREVAERLSLTKSTVSHALNHRPGKMSEETRLRILNTAREMGYVPNPAARAINNQRSGNIGLVSRQFNNALYAALLVEIAVAVDERGGNLVTCITGRTTEHHGQDHLLHSQMVDGILAFPRTMSELDHPDSPWMRRPIVFLLPDHQDAIVSTVRFDDADGVAQVVRHLGESGHRRLLFLQGLGPRDEQSYIGEERYACLLERWGAVEGQEVLRAEGQATADGGFKAMMAALEAGHAFDSVFAYNDQMAIGALSALKGRGIRVPEDVSLVGWNDLEDTVRHTCPPLTTVHTSPRALVDAALDVLYRQIEARSNNKEPLLPREHVRVPVQLTRRNSTRAR
jgi:DNA-binding LacI/PurR family transcriptional regulator